ncbi:MAG: hypothetical protein A3D92_19305 [Bacteroidetes bacterium RIFCSPHIGHO2_02_FULL_44_7]|nr:MAG: hypothetical protein A3D92_19305 [Bacteroidetes bacterium RIFCSPHIGHO2_02_FULL_44_7]
MYSRITLPVLAAALLLLNSCKKEALIAGGSGLEDWTAETHGSNATPNYDIVFNQNAVGRLDFVIESDYWDAMQSDLVSIIQGSGGPGGGFSEESPIYVPAQMFFEGKQWYDVGLRYKGNSSLSTAYSQNIGKLPFRIEMDHFSNENPNINGQTFYGFTQLSLSSGFKDASVIREKVAADVFREFGVPAPRTAFYRVYIDHGTGPIYFGLYTMVEVIFDEAMLNSQFGNSGGNCYKPDGNGARLNDPSLITSTYFPNKTNEGASLDDISELVSVLLSDTRTSNPSLWRSNLEAIFDMDTYLKYMAANMTMRNWDTYGLMTHNYYLYNNPSNSKLTWIPWDNNEAFMDGPGGNGGGGMSALDFDFSNLQSTPQGSTGAVTWPMLAYIYADATYKTRYDNYIDQFITSAFTPSAISARFTEAHNLIAPYVNGSDPEQTGYTYTTAASFSSSLSDLINYANERIVEAADYTP